MPMLVRESPTCFSEQLRERRCNCNWDRKTYGPEALGKIQVNIVFRNLVQDGEVVLGLIERTGRCVTVKGNSVSRRACKL